MERLKKATGAVLATLGLALFAMAAAGNLFVTSVQDEAMEAAAEPSAAETAKWETVYTEEQMRQNAVESAVQVEEKQKTADEQTMLKNRLASLRMMRDKNWQRLQSQLKDIPETEKQEQTVQIALLQHKEQKLELLLAAKGIEHCLAVLDEEQANIVVAEEVLKNQYEKIYDVVFRNSGYPSEQIVLIPLATN
ncbi:MAG: SpoIIIAH-like family protein [Peptococcaceae bacterium]|nr:SpoIIIAH-like family protein [Peptococcaceae bacterium]